MQLGVLPREPVSEYSVLVDVLRMLLLLQKMMGFNRRAFLVQ